MPEPKIKESVDIPILLHVDHYLSRGGRIEKRHGLICLVDKDGNHICGGETMKKLLEQCIWTFC